MINKPPPCEYIDPSNKNYPPPKRKKKKFLFIILLYTNYGFTLSVHYPEG